MDRFQLRHKILEFYNASDSEIRELLEYSHNAFDHSQLDCLPHFPLANEPHLATWEQYLAEAEQLGAYATLKSHLVQFQFPIRAGISKEEGYRAATRQGKSVEDIGLELTAPEQLQLCIHHSLAGAIPAIVAGNRHDFVSLIQALSKRNEPEAVPASMGACIIGGYNNWDRIRSYQQRWQAKHPLANWSKEFKHLISQPELYQDRFMILSSGFYSNISPEELGLKAEEWQKLSLIIRLEHESTHYFTRRLFGSMRNNLFDELIADYRGISAAVGHFRADWFLHFLGLESFPHYRSGGRLENYRGNLSAGAFKILQALTKAAAENLEKFAHNYFPQPQSFRDEVSFLIALTRLSLEKLASQQAYSLLETTFNEQKKLFQSELFDAQEEEIK